MKKISMFSAMVLLMGAASAASAADDRTVILTSSNTPANQLLVYDTTGALVQSVPTQGQGGVGNNAGGIATQNGEVAVVNFGSQSVSILGRGDNGFTVRALVSTVSPPVSVAFGKDHLYVLGTTTVESHRIEGAFVDANPDGVTALSRADGSAAQVGVIGDQLVISEKSGAIEVADLREGAVVGPAREVAIPAGSDTPFGLVTRGSNGYVTIAHSDEISLIKNGQLVALAATGSGFPNGPGQQAPCWIRVPGVPCRSRGAARVAPTCPTGVSERTRPRTYARIHHAVAGDASRGGPARAASSRHRGHGWWALAGTLVAAMVAGVALALTPPSHQDEP